jgi:hypothetical protein
VSRRRRGRPTSNPGDGGIQPKYRRAFGCVTWVNMAVLVFLAVAFLLSLPFRFVGNDELFSEIMGRIAFLGLILIVPGMALGAVLGVRTYRVERRLGMRAGAVIGALTGLTSYLLFFTFLGGMRLLLVPLVPLVVSMGLLLYALFATGNSFKRRRLMVFLAAGISTLTGVVVLLLDFDILPLGVLFSTVAAATGGVAGGLGYARAGGDEMMPADAARGEPRQKPR